MKFAGVTLATLSFLALGGCSTAPVYKRPDAPVPAAYKETGVWQTAKPSDWMDRGEWWKFYGDPTIDKLVARLDASNADLAEAVAHFDQATAFVQEARAGLFPTVGLGATATNNRQSDNRPLRSAGQPSEYNDRSLGITASYELDLWGRVRNQVAAGKAGAKAAAEEFESIRLSLRAELVNDYIALRGLDVQSKLMSDVVESYSKAFDLTMSRFQGGITSALDVARAKAQLDSAKAQISAIAAGRAVYEHAIATLVGEPASSFSIRVDPAVGLNIKMPNIPVGVPAALLQRRPDISAAERRVEEANARIGVAKAAFFPTVMLNGGMGLESTGDANWLTAPNLFWMIGPTALLTIFDANRREAVVKQGQAVFDAAGAKYRSTILHAFQEVEDHLALLRELSNESVDTEAAVQDTRKTLEIAMTRYREGAASYLEVATAQTAALQVELEGQNLRYRILQTTVNLVRALGGGWTAEG